MFREKAPVRSTTRDSTQNKRSPRGGSPAPRRDEATRIRQRFRLPSKLTIAFLLVALVVGLLLYVWTPSPLSPQSRFTWVYGEVLVDEALLLLSVAILLIPLVNRRFDSILRRKVQLAGPVRALATLALVGGFLLFAFWVMIDLMGGYNGPGSVAIYKDIGLNHLPLWDKQGVIGFLSLCFAVLGFMVLRARQGIGVAVRDGVSFFAAPILLVFELALWSDVPLDMYWHVTTFASWSLGRPLTATEFASMIYPHLDVAWGGNVYLLSNWLVLIVSFLLILISVFYRFNRKRTRVIRRRR